MIHVLPTVKKQYPSPAMHFFPGQDYLFCPDCRLEIRLQIDYFPAPMADIPIKMTLAILDTDLVQFEDGKATLLYSYPTQKKQVLEVQPKFTLMISRADWNKYKGKLIRIQVKACVQDSSKENSAFVEWRQVELKPVV